MDKKTIKEMKEKIEVPFLNHIALSSLNYSCDMGSFNCSMRELMDYVAWMLEFLKKLEEEK